MYLLHRKPKRRIREARGVCQTLFGFLFAIERKMFSHFSKYVTHFVNSFGSYSWWHNIEKIGSAVHLSATVSKSKNKTAKESLRNSAVERAFTLIYVSSDTVAKGMVSSSGATYSTEQWWNEREWSHRDRRDNQEVKRNENWGREKEKRRLEKR